MDLGHGDWGWAGFLPGFGLVPKDFHYGYARTVHSYRWPGIIVDGCILASISLASQV